MKVHLAGIESIYAENMPLFKDRYVLTSFYALNNTGKAIISNASEYLLDSGAYSFMSNAGEAASINWEEYIERYAAFIRQQNVKHFFELDIDNIVGYERVKGYRKKLENLCGAECVPVWHISRGIEEYKKMCDEYKFVAIGGIVSGEIKKKNYHIFPALIKEAHQRGAKVHGLGFTDTRLLNRYRFDSVDSTSWGWGRFGYYFRFNGKYMQMFPKPEGKRCVKRGELQALNIKEWIKFQKYAEIYL